MEKSSFSDTASRQYYKPFATRSPVLMVLLLLTVTLIGLIEYSCRTIPAHSGVGQLGNVVNNSLKSTLPSKLFGRQSDGSGVSVIESPVPTPVESPVVTPVETPIEIPGENIPPLIASTPAGDGGYLSLGDGGQASVTGKPQSGYLSVLDGTTPTPVAAPVPASNDNTTPSPTPPVESPGFLSIGDNSITSTVFPTPIGGYLDLSIGGNTATNPTGASGKSGSDTAADSGFQSASVVVSDGTTMTLAIVTPTPVVVVENGVTSTRTPSPITTPVTGTPKGGYLQTTSSTSFKPSETVINSTGTYFVFEDGTSNVAPQITRRQYILVAFTPLIVAVLFTIPWRIVDTTIREMEPFYQLQKEGGALAEHSLCLDYSTSLLITTPFKSVFRGHFMVFWSSLISIAVLTLAPLSSEAYFVSLSGQCGPNLPPCRATWGVYVLLARMIEGILAFIAVLVALLILFGFRRKSGVYSEPLSIGGLASLFHNSPLLRGFREIDSRVSNKQLAEILAGKRYGISSFATSYRTHSHGILPADAESEAGFPSIVQGEKKGQYILVNVTEVQRDGYGRPVREKLEVKVGIWARIGAHLLQLSACFLVTGLLILITYYHWSGGENGFEWFMDSQGFGVRFMMSGLGVVLKSLWSTIDQDLRKMEPYHRLLLGGSKPEDSILVPVWMSPFSALFPSLRRGHFLIALVCFVSILSEFLPITLANISFSPAMTKDAYTGCTYVAMAVLIIMLGSVLALLFRPRQHVKPLPRDPITLASILLYITSAEGTDAMGLLNSLEGLSLLRTHERDSYVKGLESLYGMGIAVDGELRIDEDTKITKSWAD